MPQAHSTQIQLRSGVFISRLGFGAAALGGLYSAVSEDEAEDVVRTALNSGITYIDTAPHYGKGTSERRLARALAGVPRNSYVLSTKVGRLLVPSANGHDEFFANSDPNVERVFDFSAQGLERSLEESLKRLNQDYVEIVLIHDPDDHADQAINEAYPALEKLREKGLIKSIGLGMNQSAIPTRFVNETDIDVVLIAGRYTLLDQSAEFDLFPAALKKNVAVIAAGVFNSGILANPVPGATYEYAPASTAVLEKAQAIRDVLVEFDVSIAQAAMQFPLQNPAVKGVLVGCRSGDEVRENVRHFDNPVPSEAWEALAALRSKIV
ncbi:MAG: aldo/keto reductase [Actinobacteria bacterium]|nr:aldo/keto reductase [Actinomycetota bacterium]